MGCNPFQDTLLGPSHIESSNGVNRSETVGSGMKTSFRPYDPNPLLLMPPYLRGCLPEDHLAYFIFDAIDAIGPKHVVRVLRRGCTRIRPYHSTLLLEAVVHGCAKGVFCLERVSAKPLEDPRPHSL